MTDIEDLEKRKDLVVNLISNFNIHIDSLENDLQKNPNADIEGKTPRIDILEDFYNQKNALEQELVEINQLINNI
jgi:hypothetical protein